MHKKWLVPTLLSLVAALLVGICLWTYRGGNRLFAGTHVTDYNHGWQIVAEDGGERESALPVRLRDNERTLRITLPERLPADAYLYLQTSYLRVSAAVNGSPVHIDRMNDDAAARWKSDLMWTCVHLQPDWANQTLELTLSGYGSKPFDEVFRAKLGTNSTVRLELMREALPPLILCVLIVIVGLTVLCFSAIEARRNRQEKGASFAYVLLMGFVLTSAGWFYCDSSIVAVNAIGAEAAMIATIGCYLTLPLAFLGYAALRFRAWHRLFWAEMIATGVNVAVQTAAVLASQFVLWQALMLSHILLSIAMVSLFVAALKETREHPGSNGELVVGTVLIAVSGMITLLMHYLASSTSHASVFRYGVLGFVITVTINVLRTDAKTIARMQNYETLRVREEEYRIAVRQSGKHVMRYDVPTHKLYQIADTGHLFGESREVSGMPDAAIDAGVVTRQSIDECRALFAAMDAGKESGTAVLCLCVQGALMWYRADFTMIYGEHDEPVQAVLSMYDVTDLRMKELAYEKWKQSYAELPEESFAYLEYNMSHGSVTAVSGGLLAMMPDKAKQSVTAAAEYLAATFSAPADADRFRSFFDGKRLEGLCARGVRSETCDVRRTDELGRQLWTNATLQMINDPYSGDLECSLLLRDEDEKMRGELKDKARSQCDPLTGLLNRAAFMQELESALSATAKGRVHALMILDVDGFKRVNDTFGHQFGDRVLVNVADDLRAMLRSDDIIGRLGGDEYIMCLRNTSADHAVLEQRVKTLCRAISRRIGGDVSISGSLGVAMFPKDGLTFDELYRKADQALYFAKNHGKDRWCFYDKEMLSREAENMTPAAAEPLPAADGEPVVRTLLVVDDMTVNRKILAHVFADDYNVLEAADGETCLQMLRRSDTPISAVLLDLIMPNGIGGLDVLRAMQQDSFLSAIPVVVVSAGEENRYSEQAIGLGAVDFVAKPVDPTLVKLRVRNAIRKRESDELRAQNRYLLMQKDDEERHRNELRYLTEHDPLTNLCNQQQFFVQTRTMLDAHPDVTFLMVAFDVSKFRVLNDIFGHEEGDRLLRFIAAHVQTMYDRRATYARIDADNFAMCLPYHEEALRLHMKQADAALAQYDLPFELRLYYGMYVIDDRAVSVNLMYDRAEMAKRTVKGSYLKRFAFYDDKLRDSLMDELDVTNHMEEALSSEQFEVYLQPKCRLDTGEIVGAEALVRWNHPTRGLLTPGSFIPIFERNGFIMRLDAYVWEHVCRLIAHRRAESERNVPVSMNVSRADLYDPNLAENMVELFKRYRLPHTCVELEITESAYADDPKLLNEVIGRLRAEGFAIEMDDFGSAYSSLNMLKEIPVDVLKLDMRFLYGEDKQGRGGEILASMMRMAHGLGLPVTAEGVETAEQVDFLRSIGCGVGQGYYFSKPVPIAEFDRMLREQPFHESLLRPTEASKDELRKLWSAEGDYARMLETAPFAATVCHLRAGYFEMLRVNGRYLALMNEKPESVCLQGYMDVKERAEGSKKRGASAAVQDAQALAQALIDCAKERTPLDTEYRRLMRDGTTRRFRLKATLLEGDEEDALFFLSYADA